MGARMWTRGLVTIERAIDKTLATIRGVEFVDGQIPPGVVINPALSQPDSRLCQELRQVMANGGRLELGPMRVLNGGSILQIKGRCPLEFGSDRYSHDAVRDNVMRRVIDYLGGNPVKAMLVAIRDATAPFANLMMDAGGVGRGDTKMYSMEEFIVDRCLNEMVTETGLLVDTNVAQGWVGYTYQGNSHQTLHDAVTRQWRAAHRHAPGARPIAVVDLTLCKLPDTLIVDGWKEALNNASISFELPNASLEVNLATEGHFTSFPEDGRIRGIDLEVGNGGPLRRRFGIIYVGPTGKRILLTYHLDGEYDGTLMPIPLTDEILPWVATNKLVTMLKYI